MTKTLFDQIDRKEFINKRFEKDASSAPTLTRFSERMSFLTQWPSSVLHTLENPKKKAKVIVFFVQVAEVLFFLLFFFIYLFFFWR
jgi:hypothetical protein